MSTALVSTFYDFDVLSKNNNFNSHKTHIKVSERKSVPNYTVRRSSTSGSSNSSCSSPSNKVSNANTETSTVTNNQSHRKLDRSLSEPVDRNGGGGQQQQQQQQRNNQANSSRYKTELCRPFEESGKCKYGDKCQFAHGAHELRTLARHPKYKTELCRTFHTIGFCPYGPRCHFIHNAELSLEGLFRPKALSLSSFGGGGGSSDSNASSLSESPTNVGGSFCSDDIFNTPVTTPTANNAFTFNSQDFTFLISSTAVPLSPSKREQQRNAYNTALNQFTLLFNNQQRNSNNNNNNTNNNNNLNINDLDTVFTSDAPPVIAVPSSMEPHPSSPVESVASDLDNLSLCGSPPADTDARNPLRLPIFSRLSTSED